MGGKLVVVSEARQSSLGLEWEQGQWLGHTVAATVATVATGFHEASLETAEFGGHYEVVSEGREMR